jgi:hypothetical protein
MLSDLVSGCGGALKVGDVDYVLCTVLGRKDRRKKQA